MFPKDIYEQYYDAFEAGDTALIESSGKQLENTIKKMAKDIHDKYVDPPFTTDFAIMFLPFESIVILFVYVFGEFGINREIDRAVHIVFSRQFDSKFYKLRSAFLRFDIGIVLFRAHHLLQ